MDRNKKNMPTKVADDEDTPPEDAEFDETDDDDDDDVDDDDVQDNEELSEELSMLVPEDVEGATKPGAPRRAYTALLATLREARALRPEMAALTVKMRRTWTAQSSQMLLRSWEWLRRVGDEEAMDAQIEILEAAVRARPMREQLWLELVVRVAQTRGLDAARSVLDRATAIVGSSLSKSASRVWEAYRAFEADVGGDVLSIWQRQLRCPLPDAEDALKQFEQECTDDGILTDVRRRHAGALKARDDRRSYEAAVAAAALDKVGLAAAWLSYADFELVKKKDHARATVVFERALDDLDDLEDDDDEGDATTIWIRYAEFARWNVEVLQRAVLALPKVPILRVRLLRCLERDPGTTREVFDKAALDSADEAVIKAYLGGLRRRFFADDDAIDSVVASLHVDVDRYVAATTVDPERRKARWREVLEKPPSDPWAVVELYLDAARDARRSGDLAEARRIHRSALRTNKVGPFDYAAAAWLRFEHETLASLDDLEAAETKIDAMRHELEKPTLKRKRGDVESHQDETQQKRKHEPLQVEQQKRKHEPPPQDEAPPEEPPKAQRWQKKKPKKKEGRSEETTRRLQRTIYVSKLGPAVDEARLREFFERVGPVDLVRVLVDKATGASKGAAFVEFQDPASRDAALDLTDRTDISGADVSCTIAKSIFVADGQGGGQKTETVPPPQKQQDPPPAAREKPVATTTSFKPRVFMRQRKKLHLDTAEEVSNLPADETPGEGLSNDAFRSLVAK